MEKSAGVVIIYQNKILLVHPSSSTRYYGNYSFPKGHIEENETILAAALREVKEEVGIKLKSSQLDRKMYEIPYVAKKNKKDIPKGSIYKTVYYWTCTIENLNEIGLSSEVVPKNQLQAAEVNWAGFVPANEIEQRIAPVMNSIIKHINMNESRKYNIYDFKIGTKITLNNEEVWKVIKNIRGTKSNEITVVPENDKAERNTVASGKIVFDLDYLNKNVEFIMEAVNMNEDDSPLYSLGQNITINKKAFPNYKFKKGIKGKVIDMEKADYASDDFVYYLDLPHEINGDFFDKLAIDNPTFQILEDLFIMEAVNISEGYNIKSLGEFIAEKKYIKKSDINFGEHTLTDVKHSVMHALPYSWSEAAAQISSIEDKSLDDKGIKIEVKLKSGDTIHAYKIGKFAGDWEYYLNGKKAGRRGTRDELTSILYNTISNLDKYILGIKSHDFNYNYSDDHRKWKSGSNSERDLVEIYSKLSNSDKKKAYNEYLKHAPKGTDVKFNEFSGL